MRKNFNVHIGLRWEPSLPEHDVAGRALYERLGFSVASRVETLSRPLSE